MSRSSVRVRSSALSNQRIKAKFSPQGKVVLVSVTLWDAEAWFANCGYGSGDQYS
jgi:hypothetical protein